MLWFSDINECTEMIDACEHNCVNQFGDYMCTCDAGFDITNNGFGCQGNKRSMVYVYTLLSQCSAGEVYKTFAVFLSVCVWWVCTFVRVYMCAGACVMVWCIGMMVCVCVCVNV